MNYPEAVAFDSAGNYYVADEAAEVVRKVDANGIITTAAGTGSGNYSGDGGPATCAGLKGPVGLAVNAAGDLFISDQGNNVIRKVSNGTITTAADTGGFGFPGDGGPAIHAEYAYPASISIDATGNLYIPDVNNNRIRVLLTMEPFIPSPAMALTRMAATAAPRFKPLSAFPERFLLRPTETCTLAISTIIASAYFRKLSP